MPLEAASFLRAACTVSLFLKAGRAAFFSFVTSEPNSAGIKRLTWVLAAASTRSSCLSPKAEPSVETTAS